MPRQCTVCSHAQREAIDRELVAGTAFPAIAALYRDTSVDALGRHKAAHLPLRLVQAQGAHEVADADDLLAQLRGLAEEAHRIKGKAEASGDYRTALAGVRELVRIVEVLAELRGELDRRPVNILVMPQWIAVRTALMEALAPFVEARVAVAERLLALEAGT